MINMDNLFEAANESSQATFTELSDLEIDLGDVFEENCFNHSLLEDVDLHLECEDESQDSSYIDPHLADSTYPATTTPTGRFVKRITFRNPPDPIEQLRHYCESCSKSFTRETLLRDHRHKVHKEKDLFPCAQCHYVGQLHRHLQNHRKRRHGLRISRSDASSSSLHTDPEMVLRERVTSSPLSCEDKTFYPLESVNSLNAISNQSGIISENLGKVQNVKNPPEVVPVSMITNFNHELEEESGSDYALSSDNDDSDFDCTLSSNRDQNCKGSLSRSYIENRACDVASSSYELQRAKTWQDRNSENSFELGKSSCCVHRDNSLVNNGDEALNRIQHVHRIEEKPGDTLNKTSPGLSQQNNNELTINQDISSGIANYITPLQPISTGGQNAAKKTTDGIINPTQNAQYVDLKMVTRTSNPCRLIPRIPQRSSESLNIFSCSSTLKTQLAMDKHGSVDSSCDDIKTSQSYMKGDNVNDVTKVLGKLNRNTKCRRGKNFKCTFKGCDRYFRDNYNRDVHVRVHLNQTPYRCSLCDYKTKQRTSLKLHVISKHTQLLTL